MEKHAEAMKGFSVTNSGLSMSAPLNMNRECTDVCWLVFFILSAVAMMGMVLYGIAAGNGWKFGASYDAGANLCGFALTGEELAVTSVWKEEKPATCFSDDDEVSAVDTTTKE